MILHVHHCTNAIRRPWGSHLRFLLWLGVTALVLGQVTSNNPLLALGPAKLQALTTSVNGELVVGKTAALEGDLAIIFKTGPDTYSTLDPEIQDVLAANPVIDCPPGLTAEILELRVSKCAIDVIVGRGEGYLINCKVKFFTAKNVIPGYYDVIVALPTVSEVAKVMKATSPTEPPTYTFRITVYESEETLANARAAEAKARQEREAAERKRKEMEEAERASKMKQLWYIIGSIATGLCIVILVVGHVRPWVQPTYQVNVRKCSSGSITGCLTRKKSVAKSHIHDAPDAVHQSCYAKTFWGATVDARATVISESADHTVNKITTTTYDDNREVGSSESYETVTKYQVRITIIAGPGVSPGQYVARTEAGSVFISVT